MFASALGALQSSRAIATCLRIFMVAVFLRELYAWRRPSDEARTEEGSVARGLDSGSRPGVRQGAGLVPCVDCQVPRQSPHQPIEP